MICQICAGYHTVQFVSPHWSFMFPRKPSVTTKNLYHLLGAENAVQMAVVALWLGLLSLEEITIEAPRRGDRRPLL